MISQRSSLAVTRALISSILLLCLAIHHTGAENGTNDSVAKDANSTGSPADAILSSFQLRRRRQADNQDAEELDDADNSESGNGTKPVEVVILPVLIRERPIFIFTEQLPGPESAADDNATLAADQVSAPKGPVASNVTLVDPEEEWTLDDKNTGNVPSTVVPATNDAGDDEAEDDEEDDYEEPSTDIPPKDLTNSDENEEGERRRRRETKPAKNAGTTTKIGLIEVDEWDFPLTSKDTNSTGPGVLAIDVVSYGTLTLNGTGPSGLEDSRRKRSPDSGKNVTAVKGGGRWKRDSPPRPPPRQNQRPPPRPAQRPPPRPASGGRGPQRAPNYRPQSPPRGNVGRRKRSPENSHNSPSHPATQTKPGVKGPQGTPPNTPQVQPLSNQGRKRRSPDIPPPPAPRPASHGQSGAQGSQGFPSNKPQVQPSATHGKHRRSPTSTPIPPHHPAGQIKTGAQGSPPNTPQVQPPASHGRSRRSPNSPPAPVPHPTSQAQGGAHGSPSNGPHVLPSPPPGKFRRSPDSKPPPSPRPATQIKPAAQGSQGSPSNGQPSATHGLHRRSPTDEGSQSSNSSSISHPQGSHNTRVQRDTPPKPSTQPAVATGGLKSGTTTTTAKPFSRKLAPHASFRGRRSPYSPCGGPAAGVASGSASASSSSSSSSGSNGFGGSGSNSQSGSNAQVQAQAHG